jgi:acetyl-CoA carboxylase carboxyltransferase component
VRFAPLHLISAAAVKKTVGNIYGIIAADNSRHNVLDIINSIADADGEFKQDYGKQLCAVTPVCHGWAVGIVANQRLIVKK